MRKIKSERIMNGEEPRERGREMEPKVSERDTEGERDKER